MPGTFMLGDILYEGMLGGLNEIGFYYIPYLN